MEEQNTNKAKTKTQKQYTETERKKKTQNTETKRKHNKRNTFDQKRRTIGNRLPATSPKFPSKQNLNCSFSWFFIPVLFFFHKCRPLYTTKNSVCFGAKQAYSAGGVVASYH